MNPSYDKNKLKTLYIAIGAFIILVVSISIFGILSTEKSVVINDLNKYAKNLNPDNLKEILYSLNQTLLLNNDNIKPVDIKDINIRGESFKQNELVAGKMYDGSFIVDIESIKQSYYIQYSYSTNKDEFDTGGYPVLVTCLDEKDLIYGKFDCVDIVKEESGSVDPVVLITPHSTLSYSVRSLYENDKVSLYVKFSPTGADYRIGIDSAIEGYKNQFLDWLKSNNLNPENYNIIYSY